MSFDNFVTFTETLLTVPTLRRLFTEPERGNGAAFMSTFGKLHLAAPPPAYVFRCERCGATPYGTGSLCKSCRRNSLFKTAAVVFIVAEGIFAVSLIYRSNAAATVDISRPAGFSSVPLQVAPSSAWKWYDEPGPTPGQSVHHATLISASARTDGLDPSLQGVTTGTLDLAHSQAGEKSVTISFAKVKEVCDAGQCSVRASFDQTNPLTYAYTDASTPQKTVLKLHDYDSFTQRLSVSHDLTVIASLGNGHPSVMRFTVSGYDSAALTQHLTIRLAALESQAGRPYPG